jgi:hypothetical protein
VGFSAANVEDLLAGFDLSQFNHHPAVATVHANPNSLNKSYWEPSEWCDLWFRAAPGFGMIVHLC